MLFINAPLMLVHQFNDGNHEIRGVEERYFPDLFTSVW